MALIVASGVQPAVTTWEMVGAGLCVALLILFAGLSLWDRWMQEQEAKAAREALRAASGLPPLTRADRRRESAVAVAVTILVLVGLGAAGLWNARTPLYALLVAAPVVYLVRRWDGQRAR